MNFQSDLKPESIEFARKTAPGFSAQPLYRGLSMQLLNRFSSWKLNPFNRERLQPPLGLSKSHFRCKNDFHTSNLLDIQYKVLKMNLTVENTLFFSFQILSFCLKNSHYLHIFSLPLLWSLQIFNMLKIELTILLNLVTVPCLALQHKPLVIPSPCVVVHTESCLSHIGRMIGVFDKCCFCVVFCMFSNFVASHRVRSSCSHWISCENKNNNIY